jgi:hypothetical protein
MDEDGCKIERRKYQIVNEFCAESGFAHRRIRQFIASEKRGCSRDLWTAPLFCDAYFNGLKYDREQRAGDIFMHMQRRGRWTATFLRHSFWQDKKCLWSNMRI